MSFSSPPHSLVQASLSQPQHQQGQSLGGCGLGLPDVVAVAHTGHQAVGELLQHVAHGINLVVFPPRGHGPTNSDISMHNKQASNAEQAASRRTSAQRQGWRIQP